MRLALEIDMASSLTLHQIKKEPNNETWLIMGWKRLLNLPATANKEDLLGFGYRLEDTSTYPWWVGLAVQWTVQISLIYFPPIIRFLSLVPALPPALWLEGAQTVASDPLGGAGKSSGCWRILRAPPDLPTHHLPSESAAVTCTRGGQPVGRWLGQRARSRGAQHLGQWKCRWDGE